MHSRPSARAAVREKGILCMPGAGSDRSADIAASDTAAPTSLVAPASLRRLLRCTAQRHPTSSPCRKPAYHRQESPQLAASFKGLPCGTAHPWGWQKSAPPPGWGCLPLAGRCRCTGRTAWAPGGSWSSRHRCRFPRPPHLQGRQAADGHFGRSDVEKMVRQMVRKAQCAAAMRSERSGVGAAPWKHED